MEPIYYIIRSNIIAKSYPNQNEIYKCIKLV